MGFCEFFSSNLFMEQDKACSYWPSLKYVFGTSSNLHFLFSILHDGVERPSWGG